MTRSILLLGAGLLAALALGAPARAAAIPADTVKVKAATPALVTDVRHRRGHRVVRYRYRPYVVVRPYAPYGSYARGFYDPGFAYHGNINGCAVDLGYGRWEPCN